MENRRENGNLWKKIGNEMGLQQFGYVEIWVEGKWWVFYLLLFILPMPNKTYPNKTYPVKLKEIRGEKCDNHDEKLKSSSFSL